ncbi:type I-E CRISPR-associated protein Cas7/Cse4/CasC [Verminephrobacter aporrectodeae subsp. tuberculatae]|uniref:Type I-E CRISPR-associated protein Cas7/Cse4/CasC n=1 Tax=Verminephrobacter aporrectodeae subsp. tuberculatae TaxID=1110392 RepID=A0ABT3KXA2_9BURK|nr:type I-E CRISPR-associated protein Cas7/Cse4/CasC [Verminephrobacter aporrectodeae]MCW5221587.1 type I-E CRISPR-associated protein Cas7/Cse4/CasC [Verminephrobacter aporrectodeae subsp. tuberculatae]MCW5290877.1 type I-E CRISPR-associated protein Cas7/Cse4/CasC [Verminephrobacter aporrectodeae subsp. tuberculatae]MCW5322963.1 type I-E CRISPR-associated protein Cas7/Cse4/CasC [Verminephrobacter aporrectodeae subsp. tuberculatae]
MTLPRFLQIHTLHNYPAALLNRDDAGLAKRLPYGDRVRTRISSQCLKRHWRMADDAFALKRLEVPMAVRSRETLRLIRDQLVAAGVAEEQAQQAAEGLRAAGLLDKGKDRKGEDALETGQAVLLGYAEINYLVQRCKTLAAEHDDEKALKAAIAGFLKDEKKNIEALRLGSGLESALFGRMVTSDVLASRDAAVYVAHSFTVHEAQVENDYFTVVDDLLREAGETGSAGIFDTELASGLYYGYVVVDVPQLVANLEGVSAGDWARVAPEQRALAGRVVQHLLHLVATVSPGAKRGSTAPFEWAKFMLVEAGDWQPRSLAGAFQNALPQNQPALRKAAVERIADEIAQLDAAYEAPLARRYLAVDAAQVPGAQRLALGALANWAQNAVTRAEA